MTASILLVLGLLVVWLLSGGLSFNPSYIPGPVDQQTRLETAQTKTANFAGTGLDQGAGYAPGGAGQPFGVVVKTTAIDKTDGNETYSFAVSESADNATWAVVSVGVAVAAVGVVNIPCFISQRYQRVGLTVGGTTPSITYDAWLVPLANAV